MKRDMTSSYRHHPKAGIGSAQYCTRRPGCGPNMVPYIVAGLTLRTSKHSRSHALPCFVHPQRTRLRKIFHDGKGNGPHILHHPRALAVYGDHTLMDHICCTVPYVV